MPDFLLDITKLTPKHAISPYYIFEYAEKNGGLASIMDAQKDAAGRIQTIQELLITALLVAAKKDSFQQSCVYIAPFMGDRPDTAIYNINPESGKHSRILCEITIRVAWPGADEIQTLIQKKLEKEYPDTTAVVVYVNTCGDAVKFSELHKLVQNYNTPYDIFLIYGDTRRALESILKETDVNLSLYTMDEVLIFCAQINKITEHSEATLRLPVAIARCAINENELRYNPPYIKVDGSQFFFSA